VCFVADTKAENNVLTVEIIDGTASGLDANGLPLKNNYDIKYAYGTLTVDKRAITITSGSASGVYDGFALTSAFADITSGELADGEKISYSYLGAQTEVGSASNYFTWYIERISDNKETNDNYEVTPIYGTLEVTPRAIRIAQTHTHQKIYDGEALSCEVCNQTYSYADLIVAFPYYELVAGHSLSVDTEKTNAQVKRVKEGSKTNEVFFVVKDNFGNDKTYNYTVSVESKGTLQITPRPVFIQTHSITWTYDGFNHYESDGVTPYDGVNTGTYTKNDAVIGDVNGTYCYPFLEQDEISAFEYTTIQFNNVDTSVPNKIVFKVNGERNQDYQFIEDDSSLGVLSLRKRAVAVQPISLSKVYDGTPLTAHEIIFKKGGIDGHTATAEFTAELINAGALENKVDVETVRIFNEYGEDVTRNFKFDKVNSGWLTITNE
jgi:hypothetical protein